MPPPKTGPAPEELLTYLEERLFWQQLGVTSSPPLDYWPQQRIRRYRIVMDTMSRWESAQVEMAVQKAKAEAAKGRR